MKFNGQRYIYSKPFSHAQHRWEIIGPNGGVHFHASIDPTDKYAPSCGLEFHYCEPPSYMKDSAPSHVDCKLTGGRCWHDGTSMYATELWKRISLYLKCGDHESVFRILENEYSEKMPTVTAMLAEAGMLG